MATTTYGIPSSVEDDMTAGNFCAYAAEEMDEDGRFFRGMLIAIPSGLLLWAGLLRVAGEILHRL
jgi:hypothetical protein